jgi:hypothetical protein
MNYACSAATGIAPGIGQDTNLITKRWKPSGTWR